MPDPEWVPRIQQAFAMRAAGKSYPDYCEALIDLTIWLAVHQTIITNNARYGTRWGHHPQTHFQHTLHRPCAPLQKALLKSGALFVNPTPPARQASDKADR